MVKPHSTEKNLLRQESKRVRASLSTGFRHHANYRICEHIQNWLIFQKSKTILTYMAMGSEADLSFLLTRFPKKEWGIPRVRKGGVMVFHVYDPRKLILHPYGMLEPEKDCPQIAPEKIQLILVPGLAFDQAGWRLGYGGGFYDRFLYQNRGTSVGITYQSLLRPRVPHDLHDIPMQFIITEQGILSTPKPKAEQPHRSV